MTQVDFHTGVADKYRHACRVARKAWRGGRSLVITGPMQVLEHVDAMLWNMAPQDFVAHCWASAPAHVLEATRIVLVLPGQSAPIHEALLNLGDDVPDGFAAYTQVVEVVAAHDEAGTQQARQRWRRYRELGCEPVRHDLTTQGA